MGEQKPNQVEKIKINAEKNSGITPKRYNNGKKQTEEFIIKCIKEHNHREERKKKMVR